ncbi:MAG: S8 family serine peptidase, partial [Anaerolineae bacterium]
MAKKRIIAHFMYAEEEAAALQKMSNVQRTESYVLGEIDEADIAALRQEGLVIQVLEEQPRVETPGEEVEPVPGSVVRRARYEPSAKAPKPTVDRSKSNFYLIQLKGPLLEEWRQQLRRLRVRLLEYVPRDHYTAKLSPRQVDAVSALPFVSSVRLYRPEDTGPISAKGLEAGPPPGTTPPPTGIKMLTFDLRLHQEADLPKVIKWLERKKVSIAGAKGRKIRLYLLEDSPLVDEIAALPEVAAMEEYIPPKLHNDVARVLLGIDRPAHPNPKAHIPQTGEGQIVAVADTGLDERHPDFRGRIAGIVAWGRKDDPSDPHGHGTHVAGSVLGDGSASGGRIRGIAPRAKLFFQSLLDANGGLGGLPLNLGDLFEEAYQVGARIHN